MELVAQLALAFVAIQHLAFMVLEMFFWDKPLGRKVFGLSPEQARQTKVLASNQGLYNGFLAAGLILGAFVLGDESAIHFQYFFLSCVFTAGIFGAITVSKKIFLVQSLPALLAILAVYFSKLG